MLFALDGMPRGSRSGTEPCSAVYSKECGRGKVEEKPKSVAASGGGGGAQDRRDGDGSSGRSARLRAHDCHRRGIAQERRGIILSGAVLTLRTQFLLLCRPWLAYLAEIVHHDGDESVSALAGRWLADVPIPVSFQSSSTSAHHVSH